MLNSFSQGELYVGCKRISLDLLLYWTRMLDSPLMTRFCWLCSFRFCCNVQVGHSTYIECWIARYIRNVFYLLAASTDGLNLASLLCIRNSHMRRKAPGYIQFRVANSQCRMNNADNLYLSLLKPIDSNFLSSNQSIKLGIFFTV